MSGNLLVPPTVRKPTKKPPNSSACDNGLMDESVSKHQSRSLMNGNNSTLCVAGGRFENRKLPLAKGRSLNDWIRLSNSEKNLSGTNGRILNVNEEDMKMHSSIGDAWTILYGRVFNITPYLEYHPGGVQQLVRIAGTDGTDLFNQYHQWVSWEGMLRNCLVGKFVGDRSKLPLPKPEPISDDHADNLMNDDTKIRLESKIQLTDDSFMFVFAWLDDKDMFDIPPGCHVYLKIREDSGQILERPYTPVKVNTSIVPLVYIGAYSRYLFCYGSQDGLILYGMGQEHSSNKEGHSSLAALARGIGPRANRTANTSHVVVVNTGQDDKNCVQEDEDFKRLQCIPIFYPILRNSLNIPGVKDEADISSKFDHRAVYAFFSKFQEQLSQSADFICSEQLNLVSKIREMSYGFEENTDLFPDEIQHPSDNYTLFFIKCSTNNKSSAQTDHTVSTLLNCLVERQKSTARLQADLNKTREINNQLIKITASLQEIVPMAQTLNELLPETDRLPPLDLSMTLKNQLTVFNDIEQKVIDECPISED